MTFWAELGQDILGLSIILIIFLYYYAKVRNLTMKEVLEEFKENLKTFDGEQPDE